MRPNPVAFMGSSFPSAQLIVFAVDRPASGSAAFRGCYLSSPLLFEGRSGDSRWLTGIDVAV